MTSPRFSPEITFGNILTLIALALSLVGGYFVMQNNIMTNKTSITSTRAELEILRTEVRLLYERAAQDRETALRAQIELTRILTEMQSDIRYLRDAVTDFADKQP